MSYVKSTYRMEWLCKLFCNVAADVANETILDKQLETLKSAELELKIKIKLCQGYGKELI